MIPDVLRTLAATALSAALLAAPAVAAGGPFAPVAGLPNGWSHAQVNVVTRHQPHTLTFDRGRVQTASPTSVTLREPDGSIVTIALGPSTQVRVNGRLASMAQVRRGAIAVTVSVDGAPASFVRITGLGRAA
jgi:hypothetical protein